MVQTSGCVTSPSLNRRRGRNGHIIHDRATAHEHNQMKSNAENKSLNNRHNSSYKDAQSFKQSTEANIDISSINHQYKLQRCSKQQHLSVNEEFTHNQLRRCNVPPNHRPACSSISQQRCHPRAGHDSSRTKGQL